MSHYRTTVLGNLNLSQLNAVRLMAVLIMAFGYASTMPQGPSFEEWGKHWGYDPSWFAIQILFFLSGMMAYRSLASGRTGWTYLKSRIRNTLPLVALYTGAVIILLYPILCTPGALSLSAAPKLGRYFFETVFMIDPSQRLPGLMDNAKYMCLAQGAIWTLRWGALLHIGTAIGGALGILRNKAIILALAILSTLTYGLTVYLSVKGLNGLIESILPALRLGYIFLIGMAVYAWRKHLPKSGFMQVGLLIGLAALTSVQHFILPWTPAIEVFATGFWCYLSLLGLQRVLPALQNWPNLVLATFLGAWPTAQVFTLAFPDMSIAMIIASTLTVSVVLAYLLHTASNMIKGFGLSRKIPVQTS